VGQLHDELGKIHFEPFPNERCPFEMVNVGGKKKGKAIFPTKADADSFAKYHEAENGAQESYHCPYLDHWHLTTSKAIGVVASPRIIAPVAAGGSTLAVIVPKKGTILPKDRPVVPIIQSSTKTTATKIVPTRLTKLNGWPLPQDNTRAYIVVHMMKIKGSERTINEIAVECGVSQGYVSALKTKYGLSSKAARSKDPRGTRTENRADKTYFARMAELDQELKEEEAKLAERRQALEREKLIGSTPHIEVATDGAIFTLYGQILKLDQAQCRALVSEVAKLSSNEVQATRQFGKEVR